MSRSTAMLAGLTVLLLAGICGRGEDSAADFFSPSKEMPATYSTDELYPRGRIFPFSGFGWHEPEARASFTMIGPVYREVDKLPSLARESGKKAIYTITATHKGRPVTLKTFDEKELDFQEIAESVTRQVSSVAADDSIAWWYVTPEELKPWRKNDMRYLEVVSTAVRAADPKKRPVWMYDPGHRNSAALETTAKFLDVVGKGMYPNYSGCKDSRLFCRWSMEQEVEAIRKASPSAIPIAVPEMFQEPEPGDAGMIPAWVRHDVYSALVSGAKGVVVFSFARRPNFKSHGAYFAEYARLAEELCGEPGLGRVFLFGERRDDMTLKVVDGPVTLSFSFKSGGVEPSVEFSSLCMLNAAFGADRYVFVVSSANVPVSAELSGFPAGRCVAEDVFNKRPVALDGGPVLRLDFKPLEAKCVRFGKK